ncbi:MAG: UDP-N-acetylmuramate dehydrogenase [Pseudomonadota bacterium]
MTRMPEVRGALTPDRPLAGLSWLRVGGPADWLFQPADLADLQGFLRALPADIPVFPLGVGSNLIIRDGGIRGVVIRLGRGFNGFDVLNDTQVRAGAAMLDAHVARKAATAGIDLRFLRTIPGSIGGACRMNAGCYGTYVADVFVSARAVRRDGTLVTLGPRDLNFAYRQTALPPDMILIDAVLEGPRGAPDQIEAEMEAALDRRAATQPVKERSAGSTFRNPAGFSSTGRADDVHDMKAWKLIQDAGMQGATVGGAQMSKKHANFLINKRDASATDLEDLGEAVRKKIREVFGIELEWEIMRVGDRLQPDPSADTKD